MYTGRVNHSIYTIQFSRQLREYTSVGSGTHAISTGNLSLKFAERWDVVSADKREATSLCVTKSISENSPVVRIEVGDPFYMEHSDVPAGALYRFLRDQGLWRADVKRNKPDDNFGDLTMTGEVLAKVWALSKP
ncbi:hypothetical protein CC2G_009005 [Coprinopsis cinerea AmutBmut pab1-1]|nr:hypothetical protein CC2G_009005 [Coprinopsis cinerea AmutBmut pab1-1]